MSDESLELPIDMYIALHFNYPGLDYLIKDHISSGIRQKQVFLFVTCVTRRGLSSLLL